jgi:sodium-independent sulfate anion transporter 11
LFCKVLATVNWFDPLDSNQPAKPCQAFWHRHLSPTGIKICGKILWILTSARNVVIVVICTGISYACNPKLPKLPEDQRNTTFILTGSIGSGLPPFQPPPFSMKNTQTGQVIPFKDMLAELGSGIIIIPLIAILESVAIAKSFGNFI